MTGPAVRTATDADLTAITDIYAESVLNGLGTFELEPPDLAEMTRRMAEVRSRDLPLLVAEIDGVVAGYAYAGPFRLRRAYRYTVEDTVYVSPDHRGRGVGRALLNELVQRCEDRGLRQMVAVIGDSANEGSIAVHSACGFEHAGVFKAVGWKFEDWRDVVFMQRSLREGGDLPPTAEGMDIGI